MNLFFVKAKCVKRYWLFLKHFHAFHSVSILLFLIAITARAHSAHPLLLISIDGMRPDYLNQNDSPNLWELAHTGVRATSMRPIFPSLTFPNHYTIVTGLYAEDHGIVANEIRDPSISTVHFTLAGPRQLRNDPRWWNGEPIWITAQKQGLKSGTLFWPGSEAKIQGMLPTYSLPYDQTMTNVVRVDNLLTWIDKAVDERPQFYTLYFDVVDTLGHQTGQGTPEVRGALKDVDAAIGHLIAELKNRKLYQDFNIIVVSDHGMANVEESKVVDVSDVLRSFPNVDKIGGGAVAGFFSSNAAEIDQLKAKLKEKSSLYSVYKKSEIPEQYHYQKSSRIPDLLLVSNEGAYVNIKPSFGPSSFTKGTHGYDNELPSMQATFLAHGPSFASGGVVTDSFDNVNLYVMMCQLLHIKAAKNDGKLKNIPLGLRTKLDQ